MKIAPGVLAALAVIVALVMVDTCARRDERAKAQARATDTRDDSTVGRLIHEAAVAEGRLRRERDSTSRVIARLQQRIAGGRPATPQPPSTSGADSTIRSVDEAASAPLLLRDSLIAALTAGRAQDSLQLLFYRSQLAQRDSLLPVLQHARDSWRRAASKPSYAVTDIGGGAIAGYGIAEKNPTAVAVGAGVVLVPRIIGALRNLF